ncbi:MAG: hypothetical protein WCC38_01760 [Pseudonocardiaceae bacterium]
MTLERQRLSQRRKVVGLTQESPKDRSEMWLDRAEFENLFRPQVADPVDAVRSDHQGDTKAVSTGAPGPRRDRSRRFIRLAAAGVLALVGGAASLPLMTSPRGSVAPAAVDNPAPVGPAAVAPAPELSSTPSDENSTAAPAVLPNKPAALSPVATGGAPHTIRSTSRSRPPVTMKSPPAARTPAIPADAYAWWSRMAELSGRDQGRTPFRPDAAPRP